MRDFRARSLFTQPTASGLPPRGGYIMSVDPAVTAIHGIAGYDFVIIDREHGPNDNASTLQHIRAANAHDVVPLVRVLANDPVLIQSTLDLGAHGVLVPKISTAEQARRAFEATQYRSGGRGACSSVEASGWTDDWPAYSANANANVLFIPIIETAEALANLEEIVQVDGVDVILIGFGDLAQDLGLRSINDGDGMVGVWETCRKTANAHGVRIGCGAAPQYRSPDFVTCRPGSDLRTLKTALTAQLRSAEQLLRSFETDASARS